MAFAVQLTLPAGLTDHQVLNLEAVEARDDRSRSPSWGRLGREAPVSSVKLGGRSKNLRAEGINEELREEGRRAGTFDRFR